MYRLNRIPLSILGLLALITAPIAVLSDEPEGALAGFAIPREWSDTSGKFKVQAKLKFATLAEIQLLKDDGKTIKVPFEKLSAADQAFVQSFLKAEEALRQAGGIPKEKMKQEADNPFAGGDTNDSLKTNGALVKRQVNKIGRAHV